MTHSSTHDRHWLQHPATLALGTFVVGTDAFVVSGLLPEIHNSLGVSIGAAGQVVTVFSLAYAVAAPTLGALATRFSPRTALLASMALFTVGNVLTAVAPTYPLVLVARVVAAAGAALYTANASATAARLVGDERRGRAIAVVMFGLTAALVLGAPAGTAIGAWLGWRGTLWCVAAAAAVSAAVIGWRLPRIEHEGSRGMRDMVDVLRVRGVVRLLVLSLVAFTGVYIPFTYISAVYAPLPAAGISLALVLLTFGVGSSLGNLVAGRIADRQGPRRVLLAATLLLAVVFAIVPFTRGSVVPGLVTVFVSGWIGFSITTPQQHLLLSLTPQGGSRATAWYQASVYAAVSVSGALGAVGLHLVGARWLSLIAAGFMVAAVVGTALARDAPAARSETSDPADRRKRPRRRQPV